jgi:hypothetical protein
MNKKALCLGISIIVVYSILSIGMLIHTYLCKRKYSIQVKGGFDTWLECADCKLAGEELDKNICSYNSITGDS